MLDEGPQPHHDQQGQGRAVPRGAGGVADQPHHQDADRPGLGEGEHPGGRAGADHEGQRTAGGQQVGEDLRVERAHPQWLAGAAGAGVGGVVGMWWTAIRLRNTQ